MGQGPQGQHCQNTIPTEGLYTLCCPGQAHSSKPVWETALGDVSFFSLLENWSDTGQMYPRVGGCCPLPRPASYPSVIHPVTFYPVLASLPEVTGTQTWRISVGPKHLGLNLGTGFIRTWDLLCVPLFPNLTVIPNTKYMRPKITTCWSSLTHLGASNFISQWLLSGCSGLLRTQLSQEPRSTGLPLSPRPLGVWMEECKNHALTPNLPRSSCLTRRHRSPVDVHPPVGRLGL